MGPIETKHLFAPLHEELMALLRGLSPDEWHAPTAAGKWLVKDVAAHLLDTALRRLSMQRDGYFTPLPPGDLATAINTANGDWVASARRISPRILIELIDRYGRELNEYLVTLDGEAQWPVSWAGEERSEAWFDVARELTERWHHQQQIRDAVGRPPLYEKYLGPVLETFVRALPHTYRDVDAPRGTTVTLRINDAEWSLRRDDVWRFGEGTPATTVTMSGDTAWRIFTKGLTRETAEQRVEIAGERKYGEPILGMLAIIA